MVTIINRSKNRWEKPVLLADALAMATGDYIYVYDTVYALNLLFQHWKKCSKVKRHNAFGNKTNANQNFLTRCINQRDCCHPTGPTMGYGISWWTVQGNFIIQMICQNCQEDEKRCLSWGCGYFFQDYAKSGVAIIQAFKGRDSEELLYTAER